MARPARRSSELGVALLTLSLVVLFVAWPPRVIGAPPLFGYASAFLAAPVSVVALLVALTAGALVGRRFARRRESFLLRLGISVMATVAPVAVEAAYLVVAVGFGPRAPLVLGPLTLAAVVGVVAEIPN